LPFAFVFYDLGFGQNKTSRVWEVHRV
jgi:hypothetical protein